MVSAAVGYGATLFRIWGPRDPDCPSRGAEATLAPPPPMVEGNRLVEKSTSSESLCDGLDSASGDDLC